MPVIEINGGNVVYEILGDSGQLIVLTPGGRFGMDFRGVRPLAEALVAGGHRVLLWDRPNCGASDVQFFGPSESHMRAETLANLLRALGTGPVVLAGGSGGARDSMITAIEYPDLVTKLVLWNIVGGIPGLFTLSWVYIMPTISALRAKGIEGVLKVPEWKQRIEANPKNRERLLALDEAEFTRLMYRWLNAYVPQAGQTIAGLPDDRLADIHVPTRIIRGGAADPDHPKRTSLEVSCLIPGAEVVDPPWREDAWEANLKAQGRGEDVGIFDPWVLAAPTILEFVDRA
ncbi:alpha/beta fold hydrolase [Nocardia sp. alder85J]|uniref:alpha/beta fold hydrolase n=1 Tax=Nocardia sp. alder85J TaxID=2862949 RepID=UPI001CD641D9|nr:alpha/beta hydrolase [Nocardia sp. alder85J]MCX4096847.1 alpha/beta hydrolase [Nocardia sp. alder85J]